MIERIKTFFECFFVWNIEPEKKSWKETTGADVIGGFAFGFRKNEKPGKSNEVMARFAEAYRERFCLPIIAQWEIDKAMRRNSCHAVIRKHLKVEGRYLDTLEIARQIVEKMKEQDWKRVMIFTHSLHAWRCSKILEKMGVKVIIPVGLHLVPFDRRSEQWWTRGPKRWIFKEIFIRLGSFARGWI